MPRVDGKIRKNRQTGAFFQGGVCPRGHCPGARVRGRLSSLLVKVLLQPCRLGSAVLRCDSHLLDIGLNRGYNVKFKKNRLVFVERQSIDHGTTAIV